MKKTKLNLLTNREDYQKLERYFTLLRTFSIILPIIFFILLAIYFAIVLTQVKTIETLNSNKKIIVEALASKEKEQASLIIINKKYQVLKEYIQDDAQSLPYYNLLTTAINTSSESGSLKSFIIEKNRNTSFTVSFNDFSELLNFFKFVESKKFLKNFEKVSLKSFSASGGLANQVNSLKKEVYDLSFSATFIPIKSEILP
ncbi:MAG: hypothetical protein Q7R95_05580 [bacterium]|nr:hypothetical protein [bacterium]